jgi:phage I-like protein
MNSEMFHPYTGRTTMAESRAMNADRETIAAPASAAPRRAAFGAAIPETGEAPEWIELIPAGEFAGRDGRGPYRLTDVATVIQASQALRMDAGLPIDYDHATDFAAPTGRPAPAAGWIRGLEERDGALWGRVEWTRHGASAVAMREYRYISPVFEYAPTGEIVRLLRAALTNNPNLYLSAISSSAPPASGGLAGGEQELEVPMEGLGSVLAEMLGLDSGAGAAEIIAEVRALLAARPTTAAAAREADPTRFVPIAEYERTAAELNRLRAAQARERAEQEVGAAMRAGKIAPAQREWAIAYCQADAEAFRGFVARQPPLLTAGLAADDPAGSRIEMGLPPHAAAHPLTRTEAAICARLGIKPQDYARRKEACSREAFAPERD